MPPRIVLSLALSSATFVSASALAQTCQPKIRETTPTAQFVIDVQQGTVLDKKTGLMWKRCVEGQSGTDCATGNVAYYHWGGALRQAANSRHANHQDWRLPNAKELKSIVEEICYRPAINETAFPNAPSKLHWSGSPYAGNPVMLGSSTSAAAIPATTAATTAVTRSGWCVAASDFDF